MSLAIPGVRIALSVSPRVVALSRAQPETRAYIAAVESADNAQLELPVILATDAFVAGVKADNGGSLSAFGQIILLAGPRTVNGCMVPLIGTAPTNVGFVAGDLTRQGGLLSDRIKRLTLGRNGNTDAQDSRAVYARITAAGVQDATLWLIGTNSTAASHVSIGYTSTNRRYISNSSAPFSEAGNLAVGGHGIARQDGANATRLVAGTATTFAHASQSPSPSAMTLFGAGSNGVDARVAVLATGAYFDLAAFDARVTTYLAALAAAGI
jgi:hypothetical protein